MMINDYFEAVKYEKDLEKALTKVEDLFEHDQ